MNRRLAIISLAVLVVLVSVWGIRAATHTLTFSTFSPSGSGTYLISLPGTVSVPPMLKSAEHLRGAILPQHTGLKVGKWDTANDVFYEWDGVNCANGPELNALSNCQSDCFCITLSKGKGFMVTVTTAASLTITGTDTPTVIDLPDAGTASSLSGVHVISIPYDSPLFLASDVYDEINAQSGSVTSVARLDPATGNLVFYAGLNSSYDYSLTAGEGYLVAVASSSTYIPSSNLPVVSGASGSYTITGGVTSTDFAWQLVGPNCGNLSTPLTGLDATDIADDFMQSINSACGAAASASRSGSVLTVTSGTAHTLKVGSNGVAGCSVTTAGCTFNPTIELIPEEPLLVVLESFTAERTKVGVVLRWRTSSEVDHVGFRVLREVAGKPSWPDKGPLVITEPPMLSRGGETHGADYEFLDTAKGVSGTVRYYLEDIDIWGHVTRHGPVTIEIPVGQHGRMQSVP